MISQYASTGVYETKFRVRNTTQWMKKVKMFPNQSFNLSIKSGNHIFILSGIVLSQ